MGTLLLNAAVIVFGVLLLSGPGLAVALRGRPSAAMLTAASSLTLVAVCLVTYVVSLAGYGTIQPLRVCAVLLMLVLVWDAVQAIRLLLSVRSGRRSWVAGPDVLALPLGLAVGIWAMAPPLLALGRMGERFGMATLGNADLANYVLASDNVARAGFQNSNHIAVTDLGWFSQHLSYMGPTALMIQLSAATGLAIWQIAMAAMGVAVCLAAIALYAFVKAVWPSAGNAAAAAVVVASLAGLSTYLIGQYFLGGMMALISVAASLAGATLLGRATVDARAVGVAAMAGGGALGVYSYGHLGLPIVILLPLWSIVVCRLTGGRSGRRYRQAAIWSGAAAILALALSAIAVPSAVALMRSQSSAVAGWSEHVMGANVMLFWPAGIGATTTTTILIGSWLLALALAGAGFVAAWQRGLRDSVRLGAVFVIAGAIICLGCVVVYGPDRYQTWKMQSLLLPLALVLVIPALVSLRLGSRRLGAGLVLMAVGAVALAPALVWQTPNVALRTSGTAQGGPAARTTARLFTTPGLLRLADSPALSHLSMLNISLGSDFETMAAGGIISEPVVIFSSRTYYYPKTSMFTCTLTRKDMLAPGDTAYTDLGGGYVLLQRPAKCAAQK